MEIRSLAATFGKLNNETLKLKSGLNVIEAANESGKSTWMSFLRVMFYGLNTRDRSPTADKRRFLPWNGSAMQGRMDLAISGSEITLTRTTARANSPMGAFSACYTGTATPVDGLTSADCGETLLGIPPEVFERSAFIRQSGIPFDQTATLEKRIASLITTGEEDSSYTDAADRLRKQLNRRRHNKTGLLPQLESEIRSLEDTLDEIASLEHTLRVQEDEQSALLAQEASLHHELELCAAAEAAQRIAQRDAARNSLSAAKATLDLAAARTANIPSRDELTGMIGDLAAAEATAETVRSAQQRIEESESELDAAEQALAAHPFAPQTPEEAADSFCPPPQPRLPRWMSFLSLLPGALIPILHFVCHLPISISIAVAFLAAGSYLLALRLIDAKHKKQWEADVAEKRAAHQQSVDAYSSLYSAAEQKRTSHRAAQEAHRSLSVDHELRLDRILSRIRRFGSAENISNARRTIEDAFHLLAEQETAQQRLDQAQLRYDLLAESVPPDFEIPSELPTLSREQAETQLRSVTARLAELQRAVHTAEGRAQSLGDRVLLSGELDHKKEQHDLTQREYHAIELASRVLDEANTTLQNRFSPALGEKTASIFTKLTKGKYNKVLLDRELNPSAQESGDMLPREALLLSQGAADQLYLALRLAICDMVLPEGVPLMLDDALVTFDDDRMAAALDYLTELSKKRQILLFTCQHRERSYLTSAHPDRFHAVTPEPSDITI